MGNSKETTLVYVICFLVIALFAFAFIGISSLYFKEKKKLYINGLEDEQVSKEVSSDYEKLIAKYGDANGVKSHLNNKKKKSKHIFNIYSFFLFLIYGVSLAFVCFAVSSKINNQELFVGNETMLVIRTSSMEKSNYRNAYLEENGLSDNENRISQYSLITIKKVDIDSISPYKVYAFKMEGEEKGKEITIVHRLIDVSSKDGEKLFTFRGDSNPSSMAGEINVSFDKIVGEWTGFKNLGLGMFISYLQSGIGIISLLIVFLLLIIYSILYEKLTKEYEKRYAYLLERKINGLSISDYSLPKENDVTNEDSEMSFYLRQDSTKTKLKRINSLKINEVSFAYEGKLDKGKVEIVDSNGNKIFSNNGKGLSIVLNKAMASSFSITNEKSSIKKRNGEVVYFLEEDSCIDYIGDTDKVIFLAFSFAKRRKESKNKLQLEGKL